ncbi:hypothetical protein FD755_017019 [Muntiacus reevesi]|uniref:RNA polymerase II subunit A C-terminal domain phosphatase SSU72 n=1 Tax=Muntiacus reevesi TaxID=9886 RepID=A0A5N3XBY7_MUNRE|nr:hypothetical protein FD755_017019 [Muntiacus reevesi]
MPSSPLRVAVVCMSNVNRSMEAHRILRKNGFRVRSFGAGSHVRLPGGARNPPVLYDFSTSYKKMHSDLSSKDQKHYKRNGILHILKRNERIKPGPERFQECPNAFDIIFTCGERAYNRVVADLCARDQETWQLVPVVNVDIDDTLEAASLGASIICELCQGLQQADDTQSCLAELLQAVEEKTEGAFCTRSASTEETSWLVSAALSVRTHAWALGLLGIFWERFFQKPFLLKAVSV